MKNSSSPFDQRGNNLMEDGKNFAIISYLTAIGLIIAFVLNNEKRNDFTTFHIRQSLGIFLAMFIFGMFSYLPFIGWIISVLGLVLLVILWIAGVMNAVNGHKKPVPILGEYFNSIFSGI